jgi:hypothetical protein
MSLFDASFNQQALVRPGQVLQTGDINGNAVAEYSGHVEHTIERKSVLKDLIPMRTITGTNKVQDFAIGQTQLQKVVPGEAPAGQTVDFSNATFTVDTVVNARAVLPLLEVFQTSYDARKEIGIEHGREIAKFIDQSFFIQGAKASLMTQSRFAKAGNDVDGFTAGTKVTLNAAGDAQDPAMLYKAIGDMFVGMEQKDVDPRSDDVMLAMRPEYFYALQQAEQIVNGEYLTSEGNKINAMIFKAWGCPVVSSNNVPNSNVSGHLLSNAANSNAYDGDFTKLVALALSPKALLAGQTIPLTPDLFYDKQFKSWFVDSHLAYAVGPNRAEYAGSIWLP